MIARRWSLVAVAAVTLALGAESPSPPRPGLVMPATVINVVDGDTVDVEVKLRFRVRLLDCWAPESRGKDAAEKARGLAAASHLRELIDCKAVMVEIPFRADEPDPIEAKSLLTLDRVLGRVWFQGREVSAEMVAAGHATRTKPAKPAKE